MVKRTSQQMPSRSAQRIYLLGVNRRVFSVQDAMSVVGNAGTVRKSVVQLVKRGFISRVHRGLYMAIPPEYLDTGYDVDRYILAHRAAGNGGALSYHSALEVHGVAQSTFNTAYAFSRQRIRPFKFQGIEYRFVHAKPLFGVGAASRDLVRVSVTDKERTILDCIRRPDLCGGLEEVMKSLGMFRLVDAKRLGGYLNRFGETGLVQRAGFILSALKDRMRIPDGLLSRLRASVSGRPYYLVPRMRPGAGRLDRTWNVIVPKNLGEVMRFV